MPVREYESVLVGTHISEDLLGDMTADTIVGLSGNDTIISAGGDDVVHGDFQDRSLLSGTEGATSFTQYGATGEWSVIDDADGRTSMSQSVETQTGEVYTISFDLAANYGSGTVSGAVEVLWNGEVIGSFDTNSAEFSQSSLSFVGTGGIGDLTFRSVDPATHSGPAINTDGPIFYYDEEKNIGGSTVTVKAFAEAQANIYQVIDGTLYVFDPQTATYTKAGQDATVTVNAIGFNTQDNLIYGIAVSDGFDSLGTAVSKADLVMLDAEGASYRIGSTPYRSWTGDFDAEGNLWAFHSSMDRLTMIDVDNVDASGAVVSRTFKFPTSMITDQLWDVAFDAGSNSFYGVTRPKSEGENALLYTIDISAVSSGGEPVFETTEISGTMIDGTLKSGIPAITFGAAIQDADGNLYVAGNSGDHDMNDATASSGGIYRVVEDESSGQTILELVSDSPRSRSNDGTADPRAMDPFADVDQSAAILIRQIELVATADGENTYDDTIETGAGSDEIRAGIGDDTAVGQSGSDSLMGGSGNDRLYGGNADQVQPPIFSYYDEDGNRFDFDGNLLKADDDILYGESGEDALFGSAGHDLLDGGIDNDSLNGGSGFDTLLGGDGDDMLSGGSEKDDLSGGDGNDMLVGSYGEDTLNGDAGADTLKGGTGDDILDGGLGNDLLQGGIGNDNLIGGAGDDTLEGSTGNDVLSASSGANSLSGGSGHDQLTGGTGADYLDGGSGNDTLSGGEARDELKGGTGNDVLNGGADKDKIYGGSGNDVIDGGSGSDYINASIGDDTIYAGDGRDKILMGGGYDLAYGGLDTDWFVFNANDVDGRSDTIGDYTHDGVENDRLDFRGLSLLDVGESVVDWILEHVTQNIDFSVTIDIGNLSVHLLDHGDLGETFFSHVGDGIEL